MIVQRLNGAVLPSRFRALPEIRIGCVVESEHEGDAAGTATPVYPPPRPPLVVPVAFADIDTFEIRVYDDRDQRLAAAVELVTPSNKNRREHRQAFVRKCACYLQEGVSVVLVDIVAESSYCLHTRLVRALAFGIERDAETPGLVYAATYRRITPETDDRIEAWPVALGLGQPLPTVPLWLTADDAVPLDLESSYLETCEALRIPVGGGRGSRRPA
jgi:hypothetical protein